MHNGNYNKDMADQKKEKREEKNMFFREYILGRFSNWELDCIELYGTL